MLEIKLLFSILVISVLSTSFANLTEQSITNNTPNFIIVKSMDKSMGNFLCGGFVLPFQVAPGSICRIGFTTSNSKAAGGVQFNIGKYGCVIGYRNNTRKNALSFYYKGDPCPNVTFNNGLKGGITINSSSKTPSTK